jgi:hypothetical protein
MATRSKRAAKAALDIREECFEADMHISIDWPEFCKQRAYITNEAANKKGEEAEVLEGLISICDSIADAIYDAYPHRVDELMKLGEKAYG